MNISDATGEVLPKLPEPTHVFPLSGEPIVNILNNAYKTGERTTGAPFKMVTVRDALSDLPTIENGYAMTSINIGNPQTDYQRRMRKGLKMERFVKLFLKFLRVFNRIYDHITKQMAPLVQARISLIPKNPGSDWRDLPNKEATCSDGSTALKLIYTHNDRRWKTSKNGALRGVCSCAEKEGALCKPEDKQVGIGVCL